MPFCFWQSKNIPRYKRPCLVPGSQDKVLPVCPADLSGGFKRGFSFLRAKMEETAFSEHHHFTPISPAALPPLDTRFAPDGMQQNYCSPQAKTSFWLELSHALPPAQMPDEDLMAGSKLSHVFADSEERLLHESLCAQAASLPFRLPVQPGSLSWCFRESSAALNPLPNWKCSPIKSETPNPRGFFRCFTISG